MNAGDRNDDFVCPVVVIIVYKVVHHSLVGFCGTPEATTPVLARKTYNYHHIFLKITCLAPTYPQYVLVVIL